jgi:hypothetical protein
MNAKMPAVPLEFDGDRIAGDAGFGPGQQPIFAEQAVDQRRFAGIGAADNGDPDRLVFVGRNCGVLALTFA